MQKNASTIKYFFSISRHIFIVLNKKEKLLKSQKRTSIAPRQVKHEFTRQAEVRCDFNEIPLFCTVFEQIETPSMNKAIVSSGIQWNFISLQVFVSLRPREYQHFIFIVVVVYESIVLCVEKCFSSPRQTVNV